MDWKSVNRTSGTCGFITPIKVLEGVERKGRGWKVLEEFTGRQKVPKLANKPTDSRT